MPCLVACRHYALALGEIPDAGVLKAVELVFRSPAQRLPHLRPTLVEHVRPDLGRPGTETDAEQVVAVRIVENTVLEHLPEHSLVERDITVSPVLADNAGHEHALAADTDVAYPDTAQLAGTDERVILHHHRKEEIRIRLAEIRENLPEHPFGEGLPAFRLLAHLGDAGHGAFLEILALDHERAEHTEPVTVIVHRPRTRAALGEDPVEEVNAEFSIDLANVFRGPAQSGYVLQENVYPRLVGIDRFRPPCLANTVHVQPAAFFYRSVAAIAGGRAPWPPSVPQLCRETGAELGGVLPPGTGAPDAVEVILLAPYLLRYRVIGVEVYITFRCVVESWLSVANQIQNVACLATGRHFFYVLRKIGNERSG